MQCAEPPRCGFSQGGFTIASTPVAGEMHRIITALLHALAGPIQTIDGFSLILQEDYSDRPLDLEGWQHLQRIRNDASRMRLLLDDLAKYLAVLAAELSPETVDVTQLAREIARELQRDEPDRHVEWEIQPGLTVEADPALARQALDQLLQNAWKFTRKQRATRIIVGRPYGPATEQSIYVRDNGVGFNNKYADHLFTPFKRLHHHSEFAGTGMGLSIVQEIVRLHGGTISAEGVPKEGATFTLHFGHSWANTCKS